MQTLNFPYQQWSAESGWLGGGQEFLPLQEEIAFAEELIASWDDERFDVDWSEPVAPRLKIANVDGPLAGDG